MGKDKAEMLQEEIDEALFWAFTTERERRDWLETPAWPMQCSPRALLAFGYGDVALLLLRRLRAKS